MEFCESLVKKIYEVRALGFDPVQIQLTPQSYAKLKAEFDEFEKNNKTYQKDSATGEVLVNGLPESEWNKLKDRGLVKMMVMNIPVVGGPIDDVVCQGRSRD
jgi:hypothetical protein